MESTGVVQELSGQLALTICSRAGALRAPVGPLRNMANQASHLGLSHVRGIVLGLYGARMRGKSLHSGRCLNYARKSCNHAACWEYHMWGCGATSTRVAAVRHGAADGGLPSPTPTSTQTRWPQAYWTNQFLWQKSGYNNQSGW